MSQFPNDDEMNLRKKRLEHDEKFTAGTFTNWWLWPGCIGILGTLFLGRILLPIFLAMGNGEPLSRNIKRIIAEFNEDLTHLVKLDWSQTNITLYILFGFILGVIIKYTYSDERVR